MRMPDLMEAMIAIGSVVTVGGAVVTILYRIMRGSTDVDALDKLKDELTAKRKPGP